jgi:L-iditol 2-dehydrogenase
MRAVRLHGPGDLRPDDEPNPEPADGELLLRVTAVGLCGSDLHWYREGSIGDAGIGHPLVLGHELAAVVEAGPERGRRVAIDPAIVCGACDQCVAGRVNLCRHGRFAGHGVTDGGLAELMTWPADLVFDVPDSLSAGEAALLEPLSVALHAVDLGHVRPGSTAGVFGCGPLGLLIVDALRAAGVGRIVATDPLAHRVAAAVSRGALGVVARAGAERAEVLDATDGHGVDVAFEVSGSDDALGVAIATAVPGARVVLVGIPEGDATTFTASAARRKGLSLVMVRRAPPMYDRVVRVATGGGVDLAGLITARRALDEAAAAFAALDARSGLKVIVTPSSE